MSLFLGSDVVRQFFVCLFGSSVVGLGSSKRVFRMWHHYFPELLFATRFLRTVVGIKPSGLPDVLKLFLALRHCVCQMS